MVSYADSCYESQEHSAAKRIVVEISFFSYVSRSAKTSSYTAAYCPPLRTEFACERIQ